MKIVSICCIIAALIVPFFVNCSTPQRAEQNIPAVTTAITDSISQGRNPYYSRTDTTKLEVSNEVWKKILAPDVYAVAREKHTEYAFTGKYWNFEGIGTYYCAICGNQLFTSDAKYASNCGWPSFFETSRKTAVRYERDLSHGMDRIEVLCGRCDSHLGHLFDDGPPPTGKRYCMNSNILEFVPQIGRKQKKL